ncbi:hypothetical protein LOD99_10857 [Oopsacas minuta]|uniref:Ig-like domain-containing protein n=1 Tax=Oopsacas minuta TaxID=111878 RepID=A0AAV7KDL6_9METZ|nr:hypothetical protein LOD99_10857 [Oopsacas minuta]
MTSSGVYNLLSGYEMFYTDTTLICATSDTTVPQWSYVGIPSGATYSITASVFGPSITTVAAQSRQYSYTKGADSPDIQLLCTYSINRTFPFMKWSSFENPVVLNNVPYQESDTFDCTFVSAIILSVDLLVQGPPEITLSSTPDTTYSLLPTATDSNRENMPVLSVNVMLQTNLIGKWLKLDGSYIDGNVIEFIVFTVDLVGIYQFSVIYWEIRKKQQYRSIFLQSAPALEWSKFQYYNNIF